MIASLLYSSSASPSVDSGDVFSIIEISARNNPRRDVTGFLIYDGREFLQYVEGPQDALDTLLETLGRDTRHHSVRILHRAQSDKRLFPKWAMRRAGEGAENELATIRRTDLPSEMRVEIDRFGAQRKAA
ncbi:MAG: BLUF domain-containing protein [Erythrobacter sp.]|nr:BLUF domain-containing protein [Erythrobacter sp.]